jgi:hypothetical protein
MEEKLLQEAYEKSKDYLYEDSSRFNLLSIIEKDRDEAHVHSKVIYSLLSQNWGKKDKETFLTLFLKEIGIEEEIIYNKTWEVTREKAFDLDTIKGRLDFEIKSKDYIYIIEMKIDAGDQPEQLMRYQKFAKEQHKKYKIFYLTLDGHNASKKSIGEEENLEENQKVEYINISFKEEILNWLGNCLKLVEGKENKSACINQYIASINKILGEKDTKIKDNILKSSEDIKNAIVIYEKLNENLQKVLKNFFEELNKKLNDITPKPIYNESYIKNYYNYTLDKIPQDYPGIYIVLHENKSKNSNYYRFVLKLELSPELTACFGFIKNDSDEKETIPFVYFSQLKKNSSGLYNKCIKGIKNLELEDKLIENNKAYWCYVKNSKGEIINFKDISLSNKTLLSLMDEETLKEETKNIATYISNEIVKNMEI